MAGFKKADVVVDASGKLFALFGRGKRKSLNSSMPGDLRYIDAQINNDQILALHDTDIEIIDAPGEGKAIWLRSVSYVLDTTNGAYGTNSNFDAEFDIGFAGDWKAFSDGLDPTDVSIQSAVKNDMWDSSGESLLSLENLPLCLGNVNDNFTDGGEGNTFSIRVWYYIVDLVPFP